MKFELDWSVVMFPPAKGPVFEPSAAAGQNLLGAPSPRAQIKLLL